MRNGILIMLILLCTLLVFRIFPEDTTIKKQNKDVDYISLSRSNLDTFIRKLNDPHQSVRIVFFGDSITEKNFHTHGAYNYVDYLRCY
ncbi:hypothetical protein J7M23_08250, partial [Candidatus Sumerlaeota bacterium]|nr:hypothetical protein [Candidatus Sumerlaeota bacterium]